jgi:membrane protease YdiL (CAAX protease family)
LHIWLLGRSILRQNGKFAGNAIGVVCALILGPASEEFLFRGLLYKASFKLGGKAAAYLVPTILFRLLHTQYTPLYNLVLFPHDFVYVWLRDKTNSLLPPLALHYAIDTTSFLLEYL